jgi:hypothetical protein
MIQISALGTIRPAFPSSKKQNAPGHQRMSLGSNMMRETTDGRTIALRNPPFWMALLNL